MRRSLVFSMIIGSLILARHTFSSAAPAPESGTAVKAIQRLPSSSHNSYFQVVHFSKGSVDIPEGDQETLSAIIADSKDKKEKIEQVHVAVWSDQNTSTTAGSVKDRELANSRILAIENYLEAKQELGSIEAYMAERSNWFARALNATSKDVKALFKVKGAPVNVSPEDFETVKAKGGPSRAVILIELER